MPARLLPPSEPLRPIVHEDLDTRSMQFGSLEIQSRMHLRDPQALVLDYTRTMMGFLAFQPSPRDVALIGLGGGSIVKFIHRHLPATRLLAVEINPHVIALRERFLLPPDDARLQVLQADGAAFVADTELRFDVLLLDAFDEVGLPAALGTRRFYDDCVDVLNPGGLLVANLHTGDPQSSVHAQRLADAFGGHALRVNDREGTNSVVFARKGRALPRNLGSRISRPDGLEEHGWKQVQPAFSRLAHALRLQQADPADA